jgi:hypothetical protein
VKCLKSGMVIINNFDALVMCVLENHAYGLVEFEWQF